MKYTAYSLFCLFICLLLLSNCAKISTPTGGPKDTIPPVLEFSVPITGSLNYHGKTLQLKFDEFVKVDNLRQELIITPKYGGNVVAQVKKYTVSLELDEKLKDSTTYTFTFREGIKDITESNAPKNLSLAFSTGDYIDSIFVEGSVTQLMNNKVVEDVLVGLYPIEDTVYLFDGVPTYFTKTDEEGLFRINNIKVGKYFLVANHDENNNLMNESDKESYGFLADTLDLSISRSEIPIKLFRMDVRPIKLLNSRASGKYFEAKYNKHLVDFSISSPDSVSANFIENGKSIRFYNYNFNYDSLETIVTVTDSIGSVNTDTLMVKFEETKREFEKFKLSISLNENDKITEDIEFEIKFNKPIARISYDSLFFQYDSTHFLNLDSTSFIWSKRRDEVQVRAKLDSTLYFSLRTKKDTLKSPEKEPGKSRKPSQPGRNDQLKFIAGKNSFISVDGDSSALLVRNLDFKKRENYGKISGTITTEYSSFILQLIDIKFQMVKELRNTHDYTFDMVQPGKYFLRVLIDSNQNGAWEMGNIYKGIEPEPVFIYDKELPIRANWEINGENFSF